MRRVSRILRFVGFICFFVSSICLISNDYVALASPISGAKRVIVVFDEGCPPSNRRDIVLKKDCKIIRELSIIPAVVVNLPEVASEKAREALLGDSAVLRIEDDIILKAFGNAQAPKSGKGGKKPPKEQPQPDEVLPWGVDRIDAELAWPYSVGLGVKVAILDTGIDVDHPDLVDNIAGGVNIINPRKHFNDDNGHGTHIAGIVAGVDNTIGVIGVAHTTRLYGVKVLNRNGWGWLSDIIAGMEWCISNGIDVINMSFGSSADSQALHDAVVAVYNAGIVQVAAAGNNSGAVSFPAAYPETIAVSAVDSNDNFAYFSNYGPEIDLTAPGVDIYSTFKGGEYRTLSGTSMSAPHVTGVVALILENKPDYTPTQVLSVLTTTADDINLSSDQQGAGLVDAEEASIVTEN